jgi:drug/metabolite transporter (DMT)-like permease
LHFRASGSPILDLERHGGAVEQVRDFVMKKEYVPGAAVAGGVVLFWLVGLLGGFSFLSDPKPPLTTLTWLMLVYVAVAATLIAGSLAVADLVRRRFRNRQ